MIAPVALLALALAAPAESFEDEPPSAISPGTTRISATTSGTLASWKYSTAGAEQRVTSLGLGGEGVYFLWPNFAVGATVTYGRAVYGGLSGAEAEPQITKSEQITAGPVLLIHVPTSSVALTLEGAAYYLHSENRYTGNLRSSSDGWGVGGAAGVAIFLARIVSLDLRAVVERQHWQALGGGATTALGWSTTVGLSFYVGRE